MKRAHRGLRHSLLAIVILLIAAGCGPAFAQPPLHRHMMSEIMNAWCQTIVDTAFADTLAVSDTVESKVLGISGIYSGGPGYFCAAIKLDTLTGHSTPAFEGDFWVKVSGSWFGNYDDTHLFITSPWSTPDSLLYPLAIYGGDSLKFRYWSADSCIVTHYHWQVH